MQGGEKTLHWFLQEFVPNSVGLGLVQFGLSEMILQTTPLHVLSLCWMLPFPDAPRVVRWGDFLGQARLAKAGNSSGKCYGNP